MKSNIYIYIYIRTDKLNYRYWLVGLMLTFYIAWNITVTYKEWHSVENNLTLNPLINLHTKITESSCMGINPSYWDFWAAAILLATQDQMTTLYICHRVTIRVQQK